MGKSLIQQKRGKGSSTYRAPSFRYKGRATYCGSKKEDVSGKIEDIVHCPGHNAPLIQVKYENGENALLQAPDGIKVGDNVVHGETASITSGNVIPLKNIPEGTTVYNIENLPGDGGKFVRSSGASAKVLSKIRGKVVLLLPSKKEKAFNPNCRATIGTVAGAGRKEQDHDQRCAGW